jgi:hypothetical protein
MGVVMGDRRVTLTIHGRQVPAVVESVEGPALVKMPDCPGEDAPGRAQTDPELPPDPGSVSVAPRAWNDDVSGKVRYIRTAADAREMVRLYGPQWWGLVRKFEEAERNPRPVRVFRINEGEPIPGETDEEYHERTGRMPR